MRNPVPPELLFHYDSYSEMSSESEYAESKAMSKSTADHSISVAVPVTLKKRLV